MAMNTTDFIKEIKKMSVVELNELIKAIEEEFGVTAAAPMAATVVEENESVEKDLHLVDAGASKIAVIKLVREVLGLGLMEAKNFADNGGVLKEAATDEEIAELTAKFEEAGAKVEAK